MSHNYDQGPRGPSRRPTKEQVAVRYSPEVLAAFRATGRGWQTGMNEDETPPSERLYRESRAATLWERLQPRRGLAGYLSVAGHRLCVSAPLRETLLS